MNITSDTYSIVNRNVGLQVNSECKINRMIDDDIRVQINATMIKPSSFLGCFSLRSIQQAKNYKRLQMFWYMLKTTCWYG